jgi:hypothetical protein
MLSDWPVGIYDFRDHIGSMMGLMESKPEGMQTKGGETSLVSFVLRFVQGNAKNQSASAITDWHGMIKHVQTGTEESFTCMVDALAFMARYIDLADLDEIVQDAQRCTTDTISLSQ